MKKTQVLVLSAIVFLLTGCQQSQVKQQEKTGITSGSKEIETQTQIQMANLTIREGTTGENIYTGKSTSGACQLSFEVKVSGASVKGTGSGPGEDISCTVTLDGTADAKGNILGTAEATYTSVVQGKTLNWSLPGEFDGAMNSGAADNLHIELKGISNNCPANIPCTNDPDTIAATLVKQGS